MPKIRALTFCLPALLCVLTTGSYAAEAPRRPLQIRISPPPAGQNATGLIRDAIYNAAERMRTEGYTRGEVVLASGEYCLEQTHNDPDKLIPISNARNLTIRGAGAATRLLVCDTSFNARDSLRKIFWIRDTEGLTLENFSIDFAPEAREWVQGFARSVILGEGAEATFTLQLDTASPQFRKEYFKPGGTLGIVLNEFLQPRADFPDYFEVADIGTDNGLLTIRARIPGGDKLDRMAFLQNQRIVLARRKPGENLFYFSDTNVKPVLRNIDIHASRGLCIEARGCDRLELDGVRLQRAAGQWMVSPGDGLHYADGIRGPLVRNCRFEGLGDDAINIYAKPFAASGSRPGVYQCESAAVRVKTGDRIYVYSNENPFNGEVIVVNAVSENEFTAPAIIGKFIISRAVNMTRSGSDYIIRNNRFGPLRGLGCRLQTGKGVVEGNTFYRTSGAPVSLECGLANSYDEGPFPYDIEIKANRFDSGATSGYGKIAIRRVAPWDPATPHPLAFRDVRRSRNRVFDMQEASF